MPSLKDNTGRSLPGFPWERAAHLSPWTLITLLVRFWMRFAIDVRSLRSLSQHGWPQLYKLLLPNVTADLMKLTTRLLPRTPIPPKNETYTGWESGSTLSPSCSRELLIEQRSYTMGSEIILCHGEPLESRFGSFASMRIESGDSRQERGQPTYPLHSGG